MTTTLIRLPDDELDLYRAIAADNKISLAEYFRTAARVASGIKPKSKKKSIWDLGTKFVIKGGPINGSIDHNKYLYSK